MARDTHQFITDAIVAKLENGVLPWRKDWTSNDQSFSMPRRANGEFYKGINVLLLWIATMEKGFTADQWMTFKQAKAAGGHVRKGEKGTQIVFFKTLDVEDKNGESRVVPMARTYTVFNVQQIADLPCELTPDLFGDDIDTGARSDEALEKFFSATGAKICIDGTSPCYRPASDSIHMPSVEKFETATAYYGTLAHEFVHWTGHKSRLDRLDMTNKKGYAFEELVAELGACFLTAIVGGETDLDNSAAYIGSWLRALQNDKRYIFQAAAQAQKAVDFILEAASAAPAELSHAA